MSFNSYGSKTTTVGGAFYVWKNVESKYTSGGVLGLLPAEGGILPAGSPVTIDKAGGTVYPIYFAVAATGDTSTSTTLTIKSGGNYVVPKVGDKITVIGGQELTISAVGEESDETRELTVTALSANIAADAILYLSERGTKDILLTEFAGLTENDVHIGVGDTAATVAIVTGGEVYEDRIDFIPFDVRKYISNIKFEKEV